MYVYVPATQPTNSRSQTDRWRASERAIEEPAIEGAPVESDRVRMSPGRAVPPFGCAGDDIEVISGRRGNAEEAKARQKEEKQQQKEQKYGVYTQRQSQREREGEVRERER